MIVQNIQLNRKTILLKTKNCFCTLTIDFLISVTKTFIKKILSLYIHNDL